MQTLTIKLDGDNAWPDLKDSKFLEPTKPIEVALLPGGMASGRPSVAIRIDLPGGQVVLAQTSARLFCLAGKAIVARHPDLFDGD